MPESHEWSLPLTLHRIPQHRGQGPITQDQFTKLWDKLNKLAYDEGYVIAGVPKPSQVNCRECGRIVRSPTLTECGWCGERL